MLKNGFCAIAFAILGLLPISAFAALAPGDLVVDRVGNGTTTLSSAAAPVSLVEYTTAGVNQNNTIALPVSAAANQGGFTDSGTATSNGFLNRSADGQFLSLIGIDSPAGTASVTGTTAANANRIVVNVNAAGVVSIKAKLTDAFSGNNARAAASINGSTLWIAGTGDPVSGTPTDGVRYVDASAGITTSSAQIAAGNLRNVAIFGGILFTSNTTSISSYNAPSTPPTTLTAGTPIIFASGGINSGSGAFVFLDRDGSTGATNLNGLDTLYVIDGSAIEKYEWTGASWTQRGSAAYSGTLFGLTAAVNGSAVDLYVTTNLASNNALLKVSDSSGFGSSLSKTAADFTVLANAGTNYGFRGVAFAPAPIVSITALDATAAEAGQDPGTFRISRTGDTTNALTVSYAVATGTGQATPVADYTPSLTGQATIAAGQTFTDITITPVDDTILEGDETVTLTLADTADYDLGATASATVTITDNEAEIDLSKYKRIARYNLPDTTNTVPPANSLLCEEASSVTYNWDIDRLFVVGDGGTSVVQVTKTGVLESSMTLASGDFADTEGITYIGNGKFVIIEERIRQANIFTYAANGILHRADVKSVKLGTTVGNVGIEGICFDPMTNKYIGVKEKDPQSIFLTGIDFDAGTATNGAPDTENSTNLFAPDLASLSDFSDIFALSNLPALSGTASQGHLLIISQESGLVRHVDRSGNILNTLTLVTDPTDVVSIPNMTNEGVTMDREGFLYIVNENGGGDATHPHPQLWVYAPTNAQNQAPTAIALINTANSLPENTSTASAVKVADIQVTDADQIGNNTLGLSGADAASFQIIGTTLYLKAGTVLSFANKPNYSVTVSVDDVAVGNTPDAATNYSLAITAVVNGNSPIIISEVTAWSSGNSSLGFDWFELTNTGSTSVDITGWKGNDSAAATNPVVLNGITSIAAGESVIFVQSSTDQSAKFKGIWFPGDSAKVIQIGYYGGPGLSTGGDSVYIYNAAGAEVTHVDFAASPAGPYPTFDNSAGLSKTIISTLSQNGVNGAFAVSDVVGASTNTLIGSPGAIGTPSTTPIITVVATDAAASEAGSNPGIFRVSRTGSTVGPLDFSYTIATGVGQATNGVDYTPMLNGTGTIADGQSFVDITITPVDDAVAEGNETVSLTLVDAGSYDVGAAGTATITIADNDVNLPPTLALNNKLQYIADSVSTTNPVKVADILVTDDGQGTNTLTLSGTDSGSFVITGNTLFLKAGTTLIFGTTYAVTVNVDDATIGTTPEATVNYTLTVTGGPIIVSEVAAWSSGNSSLATDWFELTNTGSASVNITGWKMNDSAAAATTPSPTPTVVLNGIASIAAGESVIFIQSSSDLSTKFKSIWFPGNPSKAIQIGFYNGPGLGTGGDSVYIYNSAGVEQTHVAFGSYAPANPGPFKTFDNAAGLNGVTLSTAMLSQDGINGAFTISDIVGASTNTLVGSPGRITTPLTPTIQENTVSPYVNLAASGGGFLSGVIGDPTDPAKTLGIDFTIADSSTAAGLLTVSATSSNAAVTSNGNLALSGSGATRNLKITPIGVGYADITVTVSNGTQSGTYVIHYAASAASSTPSTTRFHTDSSDSSSAIAVDANYMFVADDEDQKLRLYNRQNSGEPVASFDFTASLGLTDISGGIPREVDIEGAARTGNRIFWVASESNSKSGSSRPNRNRVFATDLSGTGAAATLSYVGRYDFLKNDLIAWDQNSGHGLGANFLGFAASAAVGVIPETADGSGFNIEGVAFKPGSSTEAYLAFRAPLEPTASRTKALLVPVTNFASLAISGSAQGSATFGAPIQLDLGGRGIRDIASNGTTLVIVAGPASDSGSFALYTWTGNAADAPVLRGAVLNGLNPEAIVEVPATLTATTQLQLLSDSGDNDWYNDGTAAKDLPHDEQTKFRSDTVVLGGAFTRIHTVQGSGATSPLVGQTVTIEGVVIADFEGSSKLRGFYLQEEDANADNDPATSEGIFVFDSSSLLSGSVGTKVRVTGNISEFTTTAANIVGTGNCSLTEITGTSIVNLGTAALPAVTHVSLPVTNQSDLERYEGMLVEVSSASGPLAVTETFKVGRYGQVGLSGGMHLIQYTQDHAPSVSGYADYLSKLQNDYIILDDGSSVQNPDPEIFARGGQPLSATNTLRGGDTIASITGVLDERFEGYRVQTRTSPNFIPTNAREATPPAVGGTLRIASGNVLNFFNGNGTGGGFPTSRGATTAVEFNRQIAKTIQEVLGLNADVFGYNEMENDGYDSTSAIQQLVNGLNAATAPGTYTFVVPPASALNAAGHFGGDEITVGFIYKTSTVRIAPGTSPAALTTGVFAQDDGVRVQRPPLAVTFERLVNGVPTGEIVTAIDNHLKSKGSSANGAGDADANDGQGFSNGTRTRGAQELIAWIATKPTGTINNDFLILGDLNSYRMEDPITTLTNAGYISLFGTESYSYQFNAQWGSIDHALASPSLVSKVTGAAKWHINSDEPVVLDYTTQFKSAGQIVSFYNIDAFRTSDHDPVLVGLNLTPTPTITASTASLDVTAASLKINGTGFSGTPANNTIVFTSGVTGTITNATPTTLTIGNLSGLVVGPLSATVTVNGLISNQAQVATVIPVVTPSSLSLSANASSLVIAGFGFSATPGSNSVVFNNGAAGTVTTASVNSLTVNFTTNPTSTGSLNAVVSVNLVSSVVKQVATVVSAPTVTASSAKLAQTATTLLIAGTGFSTNPANNSVVFNLGAVGTVSASTATQLTVTFSTQPLVGNLTAVVTSNGGNSGAPVQVAKVVPLLTITAENKARAFGVANPPLTFVATGLLPGDSLSGTLATTATSTSAVGTYPITLGTLDNPNYFVAFTAGTLTVTPAASTIATVSPKFGPTAGGTKITISGTSLLAGSTVTVGGVAATNVAFDGTTITAVTPAHAKGKVSVMLTNPNATTFTLNDGFEYNDPPTINSGITLNPTVAVVGKPIVATVSISDPEGQPITLTYNWGDAISGPSSSHTYSAPGIYTLTVTVTDGLSTVTASTSLTVIAAALPGGETDSDGDGISDAEEVAANTNPNDPNSTPASNGSSPLEMDKLKLDIKLNFATGKASMDSISSSGSIEIPSGFVPANHPFIVNIGGVVKAFDLDAKGKDKNGDDSLTVSAPKKGASKFAAKFIKGNFKSALTDEGLSNVTTTNKGTDVTVKVNFIYNGKLYQDMASLTYKAKQGKTGSAK